MIVDDEQTSTAISAGCDQAAGHLASATIFDRRYRAIFVADVVGYTRLIETSELEMHRRFRDMRVGVIDPAIVEHRGEVIKNTGDGFVAVFESPRDALQCAVTLQAEIAGHQTEIAADERFEFRIGLNWDKIIFDLNDVYGNGVNTAVRLQSVAAAGGIVVTSTFVEEVRGQNEHEFDDLGNLELKNLSQPVRAFNLKRPGATTAQRTVGAHDGSRWAKRPGIAILPFLNLSSNVNDDYFAEGFIGDVIGTLSNIPELLVVSRGSTMSFRQIPIDLSQVAEKLGVSYVVKGSIRRAGSRTRLSVELIDVATDTLLWAERFDTAQEEVFGVQDEIAIKIVTKIARSVRATEMYRALRKPPQSLNAYEYLLQGLDLLYRLDVTSFAQARVLLEKARAVDNAYSAPYAYSAHWHMFNIAEGWSTDTSGDTAEVIRLTECAIERDPQNALALAIQGHARSMFFRDYDAALDLLDRALAISPSNAWAWIFSSGTYGFIGDPESGITRAERAIRLSPLDQQGFFNLCLLAQNHYLNKTYEDAVVWSRKALNLNPRFGNSARVLAASLMALGRTGEAQEVAAHHSRILPSFKVSEYAVRCPFPPTQAALYVEQLRNAGLNS